MVSVAPFAAYQRVFVDMLLKSFLWCHESSSMTRALNEPPP